MSIQKRSTKVAATTTWLLHLYEVSCVILIPAIICIILLVLMISWKKKGILKRHNLLMSLLQVPSNWSLTLLLLLMLRILIPESIIRKWISCDISKRLILMVEARLLMCLIHHMVIEKGCRKEPEALGTFHLWGCIDHKLARSVEFQLGAGDQVSLLTMDVVLWAHSRARLHNQRHVSLRWGLLLLSKNLLLITLCHWQLILNLFDLTF